MKIKKILYCTIENCNSSFYAKGYCKRHYQQIKKNGTITKYIQYKKNNYVIDGNKAILDLYDKKGNIIGNTIIDKEDLEKVLKHKWYLTNYGYVTTTLKNHKNLFLHRYITSCPQNMVVDHINHETTDNRKNNLRICSQYENTQNRKREAKGITSINKNGHIYYILQLKGKYLGCFKSITEARKEKARIINKTKN